MAGREYDIPNSEVDGKVRAGFVAVVRAATIPDVIVKQEKAVKETKEEKKVFETKNFFSMSYADLVKYGKEHKIKFKSTKKDAMIKQLLNG